MGLPARPTTRQQRRLDARRWSRASPRSATNSRPTASAGSAALRLEGVVVNHKKMRRLMREHDLQPSQPALRANDRQRPRRADLPRRAKEHDRRRPEPALGGRHHLRRDRGRLRLSRGHPRRLVTARRRLRARPHHRGAADRRRAGGGDRGPDRRPAASTTATEAPNTPPSATATCWLEHGLSARWGGAATPTTTRRPRAS